MAKPSNTSSAQPAEALAGDPGAGVATDVASDVDRSKEHKAARKRVTGRPRAPAVKRRHAVITPSVPQHTRSGGAQETPNRGLALVSPKPGRRFVVKVLIEEVETPELFERVREGRPRVRASIVRALAVKQLTEEAVAIDAMTVLRQLGYPPAAGPQEQARTASVVALPAADEIVLKHPPQHQLSPNDEALKSMDDVELF